MERHATEVVWQRPDNRRASSTVLAISSMRLPYYSRAHTSLSPTIHNMHLPSCFQYRFQLSRHWKSYWRKRSAGKRSRYFERSRFLEMLFQASHITKAFAVSSFRNICEVPFLSVCLALQGFFVSLNKSIWSAIDAQAVSNQDSGNAHVYNIWLLS